jgi:ABC-type uncharacterized transport system substrate-binding protein
VAAKDVRFSTDARDAELLKADVALILSPGNVVTEAAIKATRTVPIIATTPDLLASRFVSSLARPGANVTGISVAGWNQRKSPSRRPL